MLEKLPAAHTALDGRTGDGADYLGWLNLPANYNREEFSRICKASEKMKSNSKALIVIVIGASYLGA